MIIVLFVFEVIIVGLTILTTHMVEHKFKMIKMSLPMYTNRRTYKTKANLDFIESILNMYQRIILDTHEEPDLESAIKRRLNQEFIGKFSYISVKNIAIKARHLMWVILAIELVIAWMNQELYSRLTIILMGVSLLITLFMAFYGLVKGIDEKSEALVDEIIHYVRNVYPLEKQHKVSGGTSKQDGTINLKEHKAKREEAKIHEKQIIKDQAYELRNYELQEVVLHKEKKVKVDEPLEQTVKEIKSKESDIGSRKGIEEGAVLNKKIESGSKKDVCKTKQREEVNEENKAELSAKDIAQLLNHLQ